MKGTGVDQREENRTRERNKSLWRYGTKRKSTAPAYEAGGGKDEQSIIPPPKYTPPSATSREVASCSSFLADTRKNKSPKTFQSFQHSFTSNIDPFSHTGDEYADKHISIKVPKGKLDLPSIINMCKVFFLTR